LQLQLFLMDGRQGFLGWRQYLNVGISPHIASFRQIEHLKQQAITNSKKPKNKCNGCGAILLTSIIILLTEKKSHAAKMP